MANLSWLLHSSLVPPTPPDSSQTDGLHQLLLGTIGAQNVGSVGDKATTHQTGLAAGTHEAVVVPVAILKRDEACAANSCYGLHTGRATFGKQLAKALGTVGLLIAAGEPLAS